METQKTVSKSRVILTWVMMVVLIIVIATFFFTFGHHWGAPQQPVEETGLDANPVVHSIGLIFFGVFFLVLGLLGYFIVIFTTCLTFNFNVPVWNSIKAKKYMANIIVIVGVALGFGFILSGIISPVLEGMGLSRSQSDMFPILAVLIAIQLLQLWILVWSPLEKRLIVKRLAAMGIGADQLHGAMLVGISDPASGIAKRFSSIEEDMGALWVVPDRLAYRGDIEQFDLTREQIEQVERRADNRSTTVLAGIAHVVLHVRLPDGSVRQIRFHTEGMWTLGQKRRAMDTLGAAIDNWYAGAPANEGRPAAPTCP